MRWFNIIALKCHHPVSLSSTLAFSSSSPPSSLIISSFNFFIFILFLAKRNDWNETNLVDNTKRGTSNVYVKWPTAKSFGVRIIYTLVNMYKHINFILSHTHTHTLSYFENLFYEKSILWNTGRASRMRHGIKIQESTGMKIAMEMIAVAVFLCRVIFFSLYFLFSMPGEIARFVDQIFLCTQ